MRSNENQWSNAVNSSKMGVKQQFCEWSQPQNFYLYNATNFTTLLVVNEISLFLFLISYVYLRRETLKNPYENG